MPTHLLSATVEFASLDTGKSKIATPDVYTRNLTRFDLQAKIRTLRPTSQRDYLCNVQEYVRPWDTDEEAYVVAALEHAHNRLVDLGVSVCLPDTIVMVKTSGWEEGGANGYTRDNAIYLNERSLSDHLVFHEIFHIISRYNESKRDGIYATMGFNRTNDILYRDELRITNPDAPSLNHYITLQHQGREIEGALIIRASREYDGGGFFGYVRKLVLVLDRVVDNAHVPRLADGKEVLLRYDQVQGLYEQIGRNTAYNIHQEETAAEHFTAVIEGKTGLPDQRLVDELVKILQEK
ncbi:MAG: hypothetical protein NTV29_19255 [Planctomycetota bacterium]|nr:hypothetical protein [Planctomycetota bacterium]